jgi:hypothetical protein
VPLAHAACNPFSQPVRYVGPVGAGSQCTDSTIQQAINNSTCAYGTTIYVSPYGLGGTRTYSNQHLSINNKIVTLIGESGTYGCGSPPPYCDSNSLIFDPNCITVTSPVITLDGNYTDGSVIQITGNSNVALKYLEIARGNKNGSGGGISFLGTGNLSLLNSSVLSNLATSGGGIDVTASGGDLTLNLYDNVTIGANTASESGGGVRLQGGSYTATLNATSPKLFIARNQATNKYGGGVEIVSRATANIGSPGIAGLGAIVLNRAAHGGGIAIVAGSDTGQHAALNLFSTDANIPVRVGSNAASHTGGGIFLKPSRIGFTNTTASATANLWDFQLDDNVAQNGTAIYGDVFDDIFGGIQGGYADAVYVNLNRGSRPAGSVACFASSRCNAISGNFARNDQGKRTAGSTILMQEWGHLMADRVRIEKNVADYAIRGFAAELRLKNCLIADNDLSLFSVVRNEYGSFGGSTLPVNLNGCTVATNLIASDLPNTYIVATANRGPVELFGNVFAQPSANTKTLQPGSASITATYNLAREIGTLNNGVGNLAGAPTFVDATTGDYRLKLNSKVRSLGIDVAPAQGGVDLAGNKRDVDCLAVPNGVGGPRDLGAFEVVCGN